MVYSCPSKFFVAFALGFMSEQLPLSLGLHDDPTLEAWLPGDNQQAFEQITAMAQGQGENFLFLWGKEGVGKTHLLQGACHWAGQHYQTAFYLPLSDPSRSPSMLEGLERVSLVCIDDVHLIAQKTAWEEALFHLFNRLRAHNRRLIVTATSSPKYLPLGLADLQSRLSWGLTYQLHPLNDEQLLAALQLRAKARGLVLSDDVGGFLIRRCVRSMPDLYDILDKLDKASLAAQRRLTIPFIKTILAL